MSRFIRKIFFFIAVIFLVLISVVLIKLYQFPEGIDFDMMPKNNLSNSLCFRAKLDHLAASDNFRNCTALIAGSSQSLCNISGLTVQRKTGECVYNISSWALSAGQIVDFLNILRKKKIKSLTVAFDNCDFKPPMVKIDFNATQTYIYRNRLHKYWLFFKLMNMTTLLSDISERKEFSRISNNYESLNFDKTGSIQYDPVGFIDSEKKGLWSSYLDTLGFNIFYEDVSKLDSLCKHNSIAFYLIYMPAKSDMLTDENRKQNYIVADVLRNRFGKNLVDLHTVPIPVTKYCDAFHLYKDGAETVTNLFLDSIKNHFEVPLPSHEPDSEDQ